MPSSMNNTMGRDPNLNYHQKQQESNFGHEAYENEGGPNKLDSESTDFRKSIFQKNIDNMNMIYNSILGGNKKNWNMFSVENDGTEFLDKFGGGQNASDQNMYDENGNEGVDRLGRKNFVNYS